MTDNTQDIARIWQVSELNHAARNLLETRFGLVTVSGEISGFTRARSGHWYFRLKDMDGQVSCAMFRNKNLYCQFEPQEGDLVHFKAKVSIYPDRGDYQLIGEKMQAAGSGNLQQTFLALKKKLFDEGLFEEQHKRSIPSHCQRIAVISSADGAAIHDFLKVLQQRMPGLAIDLLPVTVQGPNAATETAKAIELCNLMGQHDVIVLTRGGGSVEDLWSYNDEHLARTIYSSRIPTVSAVGHETDFTIADFVADCRMPTPSAAAELVSQDQQEVRHRVSQLERQLTQLWRNQLRQQRLNLSRLEALLQHPGQKLDDQSQRLDHFQVRLEQALQKQLLAKTAQQSHWQAKLRSLTPMHFVQSQMTHMSQLLQRVNTAQQSHLRQRQQHLSNTAAQLNQLSPLSTLARGYSITQDEQGKVISSTAQVKPNQCLKIKLHDGIIQATVG
ncbi:MAG: exodeoxyribonuclease VII large subunit [Oceanospirillaceae bacterium]|jgi:exodeoxyribonuclease VII large subunit|nr:exodeoxyribonuclease VII large subunit [Oceanospirillaceae bacterium]